MKDLTKHESTYILKNNYIGNLSFIWKSQPYVIPISYYYSEAENCIISYSSEGHKMDAMRINHAISLGVTEIESVDNWQSILVFGKFQEVDGTHAKEQLHKFTSGVKRIIRERDNKNPQMVNDFSNRTNSKSSPVVYRINITDISGKSSDIV